MALDINKLRSVPMTEKALREFLTGPDSGLSLMNEGHDFVDTLEVFEDESYTMFGLRKQLDQVSGDSGIGIALHAWLKINSRIVSPDAYNSESESAYRLSSLFKLFDAFATKRKVYFRRETAKVVGDVFDYLNTFDMDELKILSYHIVNRSPNKDGKALLSAIFEPDAIGMVPRASCLYPVIFNEIKQLDQPLVWLQKNIPQRLLPYAHNISGDQELRSLMDKKSRGKAVELDLGM